MLKARRSAKIRNEVDLSANLAAARMHKVPLSVCGGPRDVKRFQDELSTSIVRLDYYSALSFSAGWLLFQEVGVTRSRNVGSYSSDERFKPQLVVRFAVFTIRPIRCARYEKTRTVI